MQVTCNLVKESDSQITKSGVTRLEHKMQESGDNHKYTNQIAVFSKSPMRLHTYLLHNIIVKIIIKYDST